MEVANSLNSLQEVENPNFDWSLPATHFLTKGVKNVIITLGAKGAYIKTSDTESLMAHGIAVESSKVNKVVDTTAAGDTL